MRRIKNSTKHDLFATMVDGFVEEIQEIGSGDTTERLAEILAEDYPTWSDEACKKYAKEFYDEHYSEAYDEARETFEPSARDEAMADIQCETIKKPASGEYVKMSISVSDVLENAFAEWFEGEEFESREDFEDAVDRFVDSVTEDAVKVGRAICKLSNDELANRLSVYIKDEEEDDGE